MDGIRCVAEICVHYNNGLKTTVAKATKVAKKRTNFIYRMNKASDEQLLSKEEQTYDGGALHLCSLVEKFLLPLVQCVVWQ